MFLALGSCTGGNHGVDGSFHMAWMSHDDIIEAPKEGVTSLGGCPNKFLSPMHFRHIRAQRRLV